MAETISSYWHFLSAGLIKLAQTGALVPSQRFLVSKMLAPIPADYRGQVLELGAGTGALTLQLAAKCPQARILACEINPSLARHVQARVGQAGLRDRVQVVNDSAENLLAGLRARSSERPDFILSGIPLGNLDRDLVMNLLGLIRACLRKDGWYIQFQYSFMDRKKVRASFSRLHTAPALLNFPPAVVYYAQK
jgi:phosphatidylethanolamine/phosphatidyl-N-methylethanolamine N-methyltransferase